MKILTPGASISSSVVREQNYLSAVTNFCSLQVWWGCHRNIRKCGSSRLREDCKQGEKRRAEPGKEFSTAW